MRFESVGCVTSEGMGDGVGVAAGAAAGGEPPHDVIPPLPAGHELTQAVWPTSLKSACGQGAHALSPACAW